MKKRAFIGIVPLLLLAIGVFFAIRNNTPKEESNMDAILATFSPEDQVFFKKHYEETIRRAKVLGDAKDAEWEENFEKAYWEAIQNFENSSDLSELDDSDLDDHQSVEYYENEIRLAKKEGASEEHIASLEGLRDFYIGSIARDEELERRYEEIDREFQADQARYESLSTPEEKTAYHQEKLQEAEKRLLEAEENLRIAKEKGDPIDIRMKELFVEGAELRIDTQKRELAWIPKEQAVDETIKRWEETRKKLEVEQPKLIEKYRSFLQIEEIDGVERIVGVRTPAEMKAAAKEFLSNSSSEESSGVPSLPANQLSPSDVVSQDSPVTQTQTPVESITSQTPSASTDQAPASPPQTSVESIVKAQTQFQAWRKDIDDTYFDVILSHYFTPQELDRYFPTDADRQTLNIRTEMLRKSVVSQVRKLVSRLPNASAEQKRDFARELVSQNFEKDFADSVLKQLQRTEK